MAKYKITKDNCYVKGKAVRIGSEIELTDQQALRWVNKIEKVVTVSEEKKSKAPPQAKKGV